MNLRDLRYLIAVAQSRHFGHAAEACFVSQPTLSTQIKKLEDELGVTLIERTNKQVLLTDIGEQIVAKSHHILHSVDELRELALQHNDPEAGTFRLGIIPTLAPYLLPPIMSKIQQRFPKLKIFLYELQTALLLERLPAGRLDAALLALPIDHPKLEVHELFKEPFFAAVPAKHFLADNKTLKLENLVDAEVLLLEDGHCLRDQTLDLCRKVGASETEGFRATSLETLRQMIGSGTGVTFMPALAIEPYEGGSKRIQYIPFSKPQPARTVALALRGSNYRRDMILEIGDIIRREIKPKLAAREESAGNARHDGSTRVD